MHFLDLLQQGTLTKMLRSDRLPRSSYYDKHYRQTASLIRARQPYLVKNIFTGLGLLAFTVGVCECLFIYYDASLHLAAKEDQRID